MRRNFREFINLQDVPRVTSPTYPALVLGTGQKQALSQGSSLLREHQMKEDSSKLGQEVRSQDGTQPSTGHPA